MLKLKNMQKENQNYVIGVDGGGTKTIAALADLGGEVLALGKSGSSSPRNVGIRKAIGNVALAIKHILRNKKNIEITSTFIGLPATAEEFSLEKKEIEREFFSQKEIAEVFEGKVKIGSDQEVAFRSGTNKKDGVLLIAGTGCVAHGWRGKKEVHASGWGWLADEGSAFWVGQRAFQAALKELDRRGPKTLITKIIFQNFKVKNIENLLIRIHSQNPTEVIPRFSIFCDEASKKKDKIAQEIMKEAGKELANSAKTVIKKLNFKKEIFPIVLVGGMFGSKVVLETVKNEIKKFAPKAKFIQPKVDPVIGAIKLAIENLD